ncbi:Extra-large guanine nucleotide-binding protein 1 [Linum perenne]
MMSGMLRKVLPITTSIPKSKDDDVGDNDDDDEYGKKVEYSFAVEYSGPPLPYDIPKVVPVQLHEIPLASTLSSPSLLSVVVPVIQPIVKSRLPEKVVSKEPENHENHEENCTELEGLSCDDHGAESSPQVRLINDCDAAQMLSGCSEIVEVPDDDEGARELQDYANPGVSESTKSESFSRSVSSEIFSGNDEEYGDEAAPCHVRRPSAVTFRDPDSNDVVEEDYYESEAESSIPEKRPMAVRPGKKGTCYRCMKGNRFTDKEVCIVCSAKFCSGCVLRAMGSMPEGRKCVTCIGQRIDEARRKKLGKSSRMLKQLLPDLEVMNIMASERSCPVNQLPPELVYINDQYLSEEEIVLLQTSAHPPRKLKPGYYWYDKVSGLWGKKGAKPCQIISDQLSIGGHLRRDASNGDTGILVNNREITKPELLMLQLLGVKCDGTSSFWVSADGSYQEEGMKNVKGKIWDKPGAKLICIFLSLPMPPDSSGSARKEPNGAAVIPKALEQNMLVKLLLVGNKKSGTSTIFKQAKIIYNVPFSDEERQSIKSVIQSNLYGYIGILLEGRERFEEESLIQRGRSSSSGQTDAQTIYSIGLRLKAFSDWLLKIMVSGNLETIFPASTREYGPFVEELWKDDAIQATYNRRDELPSLPRNATYFLERAAEIAMVDYEPSDMDILYAEGITSSRGLSCMEFLFPPSPRDLCDHIGYQHNPSQRYQFIRAHPRVLGGNCKWLQMFEDVNMVLFCVSLTDYDQCSEDNNGVLVNNMMASKQLFESIVTHPKFEDKKFLLILNKFDLLEEKIEGAPLTRCEWFEDWDPVIGHNPANSRSRATNTSLAHRAFQFIAMKYKRLYASLADKKLYVSLVTGLEADHVDESLQYAREILKWDEESFDISNNNETSSTSIEASTSS